MKITLAILLSVVLFGENKPPKVESFPVPSGIKNMLFYVQRSLNKNTIVYELNTDKDGEINEQEPIKFYWVNYAGKSDIEPLNFIQKKYAYGLSFSLVDKDKKNFCFHFVSYKKQLLYLVRSPDKKYNVYSYFNGKMVIVHRIYIQIDGGAFWTPKITYIEVLAKDPSKNEEITEKIIP